MDIPLARRTEGMRFPVHGTQSSYLEIQIHYQVYT
jgi:hypothetical protein